MKKMLISILAAGLPLAGFAQDANRMFPVTLLPPQVVAAANTATGTAVDVASYKGNASFVALADHTLDATRTNVFTVQHGAATTGAWSTVTNLAGTALTYTITGSGTVSRGTSEILPCDLGRLKKYVRVTASRTDGGTNGVAFYMIAPMKSE